MHGALDYACSALRRMCSLVVRARKLWHGTERLWRELGCLLPVSQWSGGSNTLRYGARTRMGGGFNLLSLGEILPEAAQ